MRKESIAGLDAIVTGGSDGDGAGSGPILVLLHGYGAPGDDLVPLWRHIPAPRGTRFVFPEAPIALDPAAVGFVGGRAWWHLDLVQLQRELMLGRLEEVLQQEPAELSNLRAKLEDFLTQLCRRLDTTPQNLVLGGFSQGAMVALGTGLCSQKSLAGLVLLSAAPFGLGRLAACLSMKKHLPIFMSHGREDPLLPFALAERLNRELKRAELTVDFVAFSGGHAIPTETVEKLGQFVTRVCSSEG